jgi:hypothetical protein
MIAMQSILQNIATECYLSLYNRSYYKIIGK